MIEAPVEATVEAFVEAPIEAPVEAAPAPTIWRPAPSSPPASSSSPTTAAPADGLPPGWVAREHHATARTYKTYHAPTGESAPSIKAAWRVHALLEASARGGAPAALAAAKPRAPATKRARPSEFKQAGARAKKAAAAAEAAAAAAAACLLYTSPSPRD